MLNYKEKHLYPKFSGYGDIGQRKSVDFFGVCVLYSTCDVILGVSEVWAPSTTIAFPVIARSSRATLVKLECIVVGSQWTTMTRVRVFL